MVNQSKKYEKKLALISSRKTNSPELEHLDKLHELFKVVNKNDYDVKYEIIDGDGESIRLVLDPPVYYRGVIVT